MEPKMSVAEVQVEDEVEEEAYVEYGIATYPSDNTIEVLRQMYVANEITIPNYQRNYVWNIEQASLLVESFLLGLPVPPLFLYINEENVYEVIDGQQRLKSMVFFLEGYFGGANAAGKRQVFALKGLSERSPFNGKKFSDLDEKSQRKIKSSVLRAINIRQLTPTKESTSVYHIFERLNTGGTSLKPQEIRNAVFRGPIVDKLRALNGDLLWRQMLGMKAEDKYQKDIEMILRLFSLYKNWKNYEKPMKEYLNKSMKRNKNFDSNDAEDFSKNFPVALQKVTEALGNKPFRPRRLINTAILESVVIALMENPEINTGSLAMSYDKLMADPQYQESIRGATTDTLMVKRRLELAHHYLIN